MRKTDAARMESRVCDVADLIIAGLTSAEIHRFIREQHPEWRIQDRQRRNLIAMARLRIAEAADVDLAEETGKAIRRLNVLYRRSLGINDYKACAAIVKQLTDLLGLAAPSKVQHSGSVEVTDARKRLEDEIAAFIAEAERATAR